MLSLQYMEETEISDLVQILLNMSTSSDWCTRHGALLAFSSISMHSPSKLCHLASFPSLVDLLKDSLKDDKVLIGSSCVPHLFVIIVVVFVSLVCAVWSSLFVKLLQELWEGYFVLSYSQKPAPCNLFSCLSWPCVMIQVKLGEDLRRVSKLLQRFIIGASLSRCTWYLYSWWHGGNLMVPSCR